MASEKNITTVRDEDKSFIRVIMSLPPEKKNELSHRGEGLRKIRKILEHK